MTTVAPQRSESVVDDEGRLSLKFIDFLEGLESSLNEIESFISDGGAASQIGMLAKAIDDLETDVDPALVAQLFRLAERITNLEREGSINKSPGIREIRDIAQNELGDGSNPYGYLAKYDRAGGFISGDTSWVDGAFPILDKASGNGIKVDTETPTFGFADIIGDQFSKNVGATKPTLAVYNGAIQAWQFGNGDEAYISYHIPHDYVEGTDIFLHIHWSQTGAGATGGTLDFRYTAIYAKGHNQVSGSTFTATPKTALFSSIDINDGGSGLNQYQQHLTEVVISAATGTAALFDRDDFEPDGVIELTFEMDADNLTGATSSPFVHFVDIHYQTTGLIGTKAKAPDFYA